MAKKIFFKKCILIFSLMILINIEVNAQYIDAIRFGNSPDEQIHGLTSYNMRGSEVYDGPLGLKARRFLPDPDNPFAGIYTGTYGGEITFVMKVNGNAQNYFTAKFSGDEINHGRILLVVEGKEVGGRHSPNEEYFEGMAGPVSPGAFYYRTAPIPRTLTDGKTEVTIRLRSTGSYYAYGKPHVYPTYQKVLTAPTRGIYAAFTHTDAGFTLSPTDAEGKTPLYTTASSKHSPKLKSLYDDQVDALNNKITNLLKGGNILSQNAAWNQLELLAMSYQRPEIKIGYHQQAVIDKICNIIDQFVISDHQGKTKAGGDWGGYYGRSGNALALIGDHITDEFLDRTIDFGWGNTTRRIEWVRIFKESFEFGAANRRTISNQEMFASLSVFGAALAVKRLAPAAYPTYAEVAYHHVMESCGVEQFTGNATITGGVAKLGNPETSFAGKNYYFTTLKGTTHEPGWVSPDCYGNQGNAYVEIYQMTKTYLGGEGDKRALKVAIQHSKTQASFTYAWTKDGNRAILAEGFDCVRNIYVPGKIYYGSEEVAGASGDNILMGFMKQMFDDGNLDIDKSPRTMSSVYYLDLIKNLLDKQYTARIPGSPDQPDFFTADEENGIVTIKNGKDRIALNMFYRTGEDNKLVKAHHISENNERFIEFRPQYTHYRTNGKFVTRGKSVMSWSGEAPDAPISAYAGQRDTIPLGPRGIIDLYQIRYGNYFIAMNTTRPGFDETIIFPGELVGQSVYCLHTGKIMVLPAKMTIPALTTFIFKTTGQLVKTGSIPAKTIPSNKDSILAKVTELESFAQKTGTIHNIAVIPTIGFYPHEYFNTFIQALSRAKFMAYNTSASQTQVDAALSGLDTAYDNLLKNKFTADKK